MNTSPTVVTAVDEDFQAFFSDVYNWYLNPSYFNEIELEDVDQTFYYGVAFDTLALSGSLAECNVVFDSCGWIFGDLNVILAGIGLNCFDWISGLGEDPNVFCVLGYHIFGTNTIQVPTTVFNEDAVEVGQTAENINNGVAVLEDIAVIFERVIDIEVGGAEIPTSDDDELGDPDGRRGFELHIVLADIWGAIFGRNNVFPTTPDIVHVTGHRIAFIGPFHLALEYVDPIFSIPRTRSAAPKGLPPTWLLVSNPDRPEDAKNIALGTVSSPLLSPGVLYNEMQSADDMYLDCLDYDIFPISFTNGYNSNSFVHGLVQVTNGIADIDLNRFVGGGKPVPAIFFQGGMCN